VYHNKTFLTALKYPDPSSIAERDMSKATMKESLFSAKQLVPMAVGSLLYAALTLPFEMYRAGTVFFVNPTIAIPMFFGIVFGPITGFVVGLIGTVLSDFLSFGGFFWNWEIGNGLVGAIPGIAYLVMKRTDWTKTRGLAITAVLAVVASVVGIGFFAMTDYLFQTGLGLGSADSALAEFYSFAGSYALNGVILTPILLYAYARATTGRARKT